MAFLLASNGCKAPSAANIQLRKENQLLRAKVDDLERRHAADEAQMRAVASRSGTTTAQALSPDQLDKLFTVHGIELGRLTGVDDQGTLKVYATPTDEAGQAIKAAGSFVIDAFDLAKQGGDNRVGHWEFSLDQAKQNWVGQALLHCYVLTLPWPQGTRPEHPELTLKVLFTDALTGRAFEVQKVVKISPAR